MRKKKLLFSTWMAAVALVGSLFAFAWAGGTPAPALAGNDAWSVVTSPNLGSANNFLRGVSTVDSDTAFAVGFHNNSSSGYDTSVLLWDGSDWSQEGSDNLGFYENQLHAVSAASETDAWAVGNGTYLASTQYPRTLILRRTSNTETPTGYQWDVVPSPYRLAANNTLRGVATLDENNAWAVGFSYVGSPLPWLLQWDGTSWEEVEVPLPQNADYAALYSVSVSEEQVWAVGTYIDENHDYQTLTIYRDLAGDDWELAESPNEDGDNRLLGVKTVANGDTWAVGAFEYGTVSGHALTMRLEEGWTIYPSAYPTHTDHLASVDYSFGTSFWAVGTTYNSPHQTLSEYWDGDEWIGISTPNVGTSHNRLHSVSVKPGSSACGGGRMWAVGEYYHTTNSEYQNLILEYTFIPSC
ncbi:MAG: hypothetical protein WCD37_00315 [Chloroflexia bacterium]